MPRRTTRREPPSLEFLQGGKSAPARIVAAGMRDLERELERQHREREATRKQFDRAQRGTQAAIGEMLSKDRRVAASIKQLKALDTRARGQKAERPPLAKEEQRTALRSILVTRTKPFDYQWAWGAQSGGGTASPAASAAGGTMSIYASNAGNNASASARAALGIYFRPTVANGILRLTSTPAFNYFWWTICSFASAHSDGFIGLYVGKYTLAGGFDSAPVNQTLWQWSDDSWWSGAGTNSGSTSGYPLFAQFNVDSAHYYAMWVWIGGSASGAGWSWWGGSGAGSRINLTLPSITWELF
jgi:hypothetical protein